MSVVLACDLGGGSFRAALVDDACVTRAGHRIAMDPPVPRGGVSEADPMTWWRALEDSAEVLRRAEPRLFADIAAVAISAFTRSQVMVGRDGGLLRPAILWNDSRSGAILDRLRSAVSPAHPEAAQLGVFHPLARLAWLGQEEPAVIAAAAHVLEPKDWLNHQLTGVAATDPVSMARLIAAAETDVDGASLFDAAGLDPGLFPPRRPPVSIMGRVRPDLAGALAALAGVPVVTMANDTWASVVGLGALRPGLGYNLSGTTEVLGIVTPRRAEAEGLLTIDWTGDGTGWQLGGPSQTGGDALAWLAGLFDHASSDAFEAMLAAPRDPDPILFLPFLQGERTPYWDPSLRGAFIGLNRRHGKADLAHAVLEGVACLNRIVLDRAEAAAGAAVSEIRFGGGGAANRRWRQVKADVMNRPIVCPRGDEPGLTGAAIAAFTALGRHADLAAAQDALAPASERCTPAPEARRRYDRLHALFEEAVAAVNPISRQLADWTPVKPIAIAPRDAAVSTPGAADA